MAQILVPISTITNTSWTLVGDATVHQCIDETTAAADDNTTHIAATVAGATCEVRLGTPPLIPTDRSSHVFRARARAASTTNLRCILKQMPAGTVIKDMIIDIGASWATWVINLSVAEANLITDYTQLNVNILPRTYAAGDVVRCTAIELEVPTPIPMRATRLAAEVGAKPGTPKLRASRFAAEIGAHNAAILRATRFAAEVGAHSMKIPLRVTRFAAEVGAHVVTVPSLGLRASRFAAEVGAHRVIIPPVAGVAVTAGVLPTPIPTLIRHNWNGEAVLETAWQTDVTAARTVSEERRGALAKPYRTLTASLTGLRVDDATQLWQNLQRHSQQRTIVPLYCDFSKVTAASSGTTINCATSYRRFFVGGWVAIHAWARPNNLPANPAYRKIVALTSTTITVDAALPQTYPIGARAFPVLEVLPNLEGSALFLSDQTCQVDLQVREIVGKSALNPTTLTIPAGVSTYLGAPIFNVAPDWSANLKSGPLRDGEEGGQGLGTVQDLLGDRPRQRHALEITALRRSQAWKVIQFFDYVMGRLRDFWLVAPESIHDVVSATTTSLTIRAIGNFLDLQKFWPAVGILKLDGTVVVRNISSYVDNGNSTWTLGFADSGTPLSAALIRRATSAHHVRLESDAMKERWSTDETMSTQLTMIDVLEEKDVGLTGIFEPPTTDPPPVQVPNLYLWVDASMNTWVWQGPPNIDQRIVPLIPGPTIGLQARCGVWDDIRGSPSDPCLDGDGQNNFELRPWIYVPGIQSVSNGNATAQFAGASPGHSMYLQASAPQFWSNADGLTFFINLRTTGQTSALYEGVFLRLKGCFEFWTNDLFAPHDGATHSHKVCFFETQDTVDETRWIVGPDFRTNETMTLIVTWKPSTYARLYKGGTLVGSAATPAAQIAPDTHAREVEIPRLAVASGGSGDGSIGFSWNVNAIGIYKRALTSAEINFLGLYLSGRYGSFWTPIP